MPMRVVITDLLTSSCELSGKSDVECIRVQLDESTPEMVVMPAELLRLLRFKKKQQESISGPKQPDKKGAMS